MSNNIINNWNNYNRRAANHWLPRTYASRFPKSLTTKDLRPPGSTGSCKSLITSSLQQKKSFISYLTFEQKSDTIFSCVTLTAIAPIPKTTPREPIHSQARVAAQETTTASLYRGMNFGIWTKVSLSCAWSLSMRAIESSSWVGQALKGGRNFLAERKKSQSH